MQYPRLLCLATTILLHASSSVQCDGELADSLRNGLRSHVPDVSSEFEGGVRLGLSLEDEGPDVLLVLDPNGVICWEQVELDSFTNGTLLHWLYQQHDVFTMTDSKGDYVQVIHRRDTGHGSQRKAFTLLQLQK